MSIQTIKIGTLEYLTAEGISAPHGFTTRYGGVSEGFLSSMNLGLHREDAPGNVEENFRILGNAIGFDPQKLVTTRQIHSDIVTKVGRENWGKHLVEGGSPVCDALITNEPGTALLIFTADCTPLLFHDPVTGAVGAAHAGWRGTAKGIAARVVEAMAENYGAKPENIHAAIGPNIAQCHFETDADVSDAMRAAFGPEVGQYIEERNGKYFLDLKAINALVLRRSGVKHIELSDACTVCQCDRFWSHRVTQGRRGAQGAVIVCGEGCK